MPDFGLDDKVNGFYALISDLTDEVIEEAITHFAEERAKNLSVEIEDQLDELGGDKTLDYIALCKMVVHTRCFWVRTNGPLSTPHP